MERNGRLSINRFLCLCIYLIAVSMKSSWPPIRIDQKTAGFLVVDAFTTQKRILPNRLNDLNGKVRCNRLSSRANPRIGNYISGKKASSRQLRLMSHRVAVIGGGLAGLSTAYHVLEKSLSADITIFDRQPPGVGGASAVAGG